MVAQKHFTLFFLLASAMGFRRVTSLEEYKLGVLLPYSYDGEPEYPSAKYYASAVTLAVEKVNSDPALLKGAKLSFVWNNTACNQSKMIEQQHWQIEQGVVGFIGSSCHGRKAAKIAARHNLAVVSFDCQNSHVSNKRLYPNFARTNPQHSRAAFKILDLLKEKSWTQVNVVYQTSRKWIVFKRFLLRLLKRKGVEVRRRLRIKPLAFALEEVSIPELVSTVTSKSQATILVTPLDVAREIVYNIQTFFEEKPSAVYSQHNFISVPMNRLATNINTRLPFKWFFSSFAMPSPERTNRTKRAFKKLLVVTNVPEKETGLFKAFEKNLKQKASQTPWFSNVYQGCLYSYSDGSCFFDKSTSKVPLKGVYLYDAIIQFAKGLHEVREAGQKPTGPNIINKLKGTRFIGADGYQHEFDENADVIYNYTVLHLTKDANNELNMLPVESNNRIFSN